MKRMVIAALVIALLAAGLWGYATFVNPNVLAGFGAAGGRQTAQNAATPAPQDDLENVIWASGRLVPETWAALSPASGGTVQAVYAAEGEWVDQGQVLLDVDNGILQSEVHIAEAALAEAQAAHAKLVAPATDAQVAAALAELAAARAEVALAEGRIQEVEAAIEAVQAELQITRERYNELASHPTEAERRAAAAEVAIAEAAVNQTQAAYNLVRGDPRIGARPESMALQQATSQLERAQANHQLATQGATAQELAVARAQITAAQAQVTVAESQLPSTEAAVLSARARRSSAQAALDSLLTGPTPEEIAMSEARGQSAQASLASAQARLRQAQIIAPFDGQVGAISIRLGELSQPGQTLMLLGDTRQMYVETTDLRETDVVRLRVGLPVEVSFDALPDRTFDGTITRIAPVSSTERGSTNYTVRIDVANLDESLRWGMTAFVNIQT